MARDAAAVSVDGSRLERGASYQAALRPGRNVFTVVVRTGDGTTGTDALTVDRAR